MANPTGSHIWTKRAVFVLIAFTIMVIQLVPQSMEPRVALIGPWQLRLVPPDVCLAVTLAWVVRRPKFAPVWIIAPLFLLGDLVFQRPPGLWAGLVVVLTEQLRKRSREFRTLPFLAEWGSIALSIVAISLANRIILFVLAVPVAPFGMILLQMILTIAAYPLVVLVMHYLFGITRVTPGETGGRGQSI
ncbi:hypothetical protein [Loktanella sp. S4079]|uniref:hypothetical protein n=1 Tax=Loktanella sp. S4079 TaxID=579483 RepID=UPI0005FA681E|nr:hypothetical protein [Loktanella sp. S4079]KJZ18344.1 membrane protein [Loktanella sp. S4079]